MSQSIQSSVEPTEPEVLTKASDALRPYLKDASQAPDAAMQVVSAMRLHIGPLPAPETFGGYEDILPGAASRIMAMATQEQKHRHRMELAESAYPFVGLLAGFLTVLLCIGGAVFLALHAQPAIAALLLGAPLIGAAGWFIKGRLPSRTDRD